MSRNVLPVLLAASTLLALSCQLAPPQTAGQQPTPTPSPTPTPTPTPEPTPTPTPRPVEYVTEQPVTLLMTAASSMSFTIEVKDQAFNPVRTDLWLYRWDGAQYVPFKDFTVPGAKRRSANFMLPAVVLGASTSFVPANDGGLNGLLTDGSSRQDIDGLVTVNLSGGVPDGTKILVAAAREDQRYYGAKVFTLPNGTPSDAPPYNAPEQHIKRTFVDDVKPILQARCVSCHVGNFQPMDTVNDLLNRSIYPNRTEYMVEAGSPALSGLVRRSVPGLGNEAKKWYGKNGWRWNFDVNGNIAADRRMPPESFVGETPESDGKQAYFDTHLDEFKILYDWVAQGAPER